MQQVGSPGRSLVRLRSRYGDAARIGQVGEQATVELLERWFGSDERVVLFNDLRVPGRAGPQGWANMDHVLVRGRRVVVLDSKMWRSGIYWSVAGRCFRGWRRFREAERRTVGMAVDRLSRQLGPGYVVSGALIVHTAGSMSLRWLSAPDGVKILYAPRARRWIWWRLRFGGRADPRVLQVLEGLR